MNSPGAYQKTPIGTNNRMAIVCYAFGGGLVSIGAKMVSDVARLGFSLFVGGGNFRRIRDKLEPSGGHRCCGLSSPPSYDVRRSNDEKLCGFT